MPNVTSCYVRPSRPVQGRPGHFIKRFISNRSDYLTRRHARFPAKRVIFNGPKPLAYARTVLSVHPLAEVSALA
jgi:hypothetical protein